MSMLMMWPSLLTSLLTSPLPQLASVAFCMSQTNPTWTTSQLHKHEQLGFHACLLQHLFQVLDIRHRDLIGQLHDRLNLAQ
jgi:hypothetical protein